MRKEQTASLLLSVVALIVLPSIAAAQSGGAPLDLTGIWKTAEGEEVMVKQEDVIVNAWFSSGGACRFGGARNYFFKAELQGNSLKGPMMVCTSDERLVHCVPVAVPPVTDTTFTATASPDKIEGTYFSEGWIGGTDESGHPINCRKDSRKDTRPPFTLTRGCDCKDMLAPNAEPAKLWEGMYAGLTNTAITPANKIALIRFWSNCEGAKLLKDLSDMPCPSSWNAPAGCKLGSKIKFKLNFKNLPPNASEAGDIWPDGPYPDPETADPNALKNFIYTATIMNQGNSSPSATYTYPGGCFNYSFSDGSSEMAATIHHELLHIWFMNKYQTDLHNSGHQPVHNCSDYNAEFLARERDFYRAMDKLEKCMKTNP